MANDLNLLNLQIRKKCIISWNMFEFWPDWTTDNELVALEHKKIPPFGYNGKNRVFLGCLPTQ